jgi:hypothetical protein
MEKIYPVSNLKYLEYEHAFPRFSIQICFYNLFRAILGHRQLSDE